MSRSPNLVLDSIGSCIEHLKSRRRRVLEFIIHVGCSNKALFCDIVLLGDLIVRIVQERGLVEGTQLVHSFLEVQINLLFVVLLAHKLLELVR